MKKFYKAFLSNVFALILATADRCAVRPTRKPVSASSFAMVVLVFSVLLITRSASGTTRYVAQTAGTFSGGTACNGQTAITPATWNSTAEAPGDITFVCGKITGIAGQQGLSFNWSGTSGSPLTLTFDTGAVLTNPVWSGNGAINVYGQSNIVIDGGTNGIIQNTANGTGLAYDQLSQGVALQNGGSNITVKNLTVSNICHRNTNDVGVQCTTSGNNSYAISMMSTGGQSWSNISFIGNTITDAFAGFFFNGTGSDSGILVQHNTIRRTNWAIAGQTNHLTVDGNDIACVVGATCNWEDAADANHHDGIFPFPQSFAMKVEAVSNNWVHDIIGHTTAYYFNDPGGSGSSLPGTVFYNNIFSTTAGQIGPANGDLLPPPGSVIVNNTFIGPTVTHIDLSGSNTVQNNIMMTPTNTVVEIYSVTSDTFSHNDYYNVASGWNRSSTTWSSLAAWQAGSTSICSGGCDITGSISSNPNLSSAFVPSSGSPVIGAGANLTSLGISGLSQGPPQYFGASYACGIGCASRPTSGAWDIGAYSYGSSSVANTPSAPTNLIGQVM